MFYSSNPRKNGALDKIFSQDFYENTVYECPGLKENLNQIIKASSFMVSVLKAVGIYNFVFAMMFIIAFKCFMKTTIRNLKFYKKVFYVGTWLGFVVICVELVFFYFEAGFKDFELVKHSGMKDGNYVMYRKLEFCWAGMFFLYFAVFAILQASIVNTVSICKHFKLD